MNYQDSNFVFSTTTKLIVNKQYKKFKLLKK